MYFSATYSVMWLGAGQGHHPHSLFLVFLPWVYLLLTQTEAKLTGFKADLLCSPLGESLYLCRHFLYGLINSKAGLAGGRASADPCLPLFPVSGRSRILTATLDEDFVLEKS